MTKRLFLGPRSAVFFSGGVLRHVPVPAWARQMMTSHLAPKNVVNFYAHPADMCVEPGSAKWGQWVKFAEIGQNFIT